jgi:hypothetical protein
MEIAETGWAKQATDQPGLDDLTCDKTVFRLARPRRLGHHRRDVENELPTEKWQAILASRFKISNFRRKNDKGVAEKKFAAIGFYL